MENNINLGNHLFNKQQLTRSKIKYLFFIAILEKDHPS
jgi:hypothetical protein